MRGDYCIAARKNVDDALNKVDDALNNMDGCGAYSRGTHLLVHQLSVLVLDQLTHVCEFDARLWMRVNA